MKNLLIVLLLSSVLLFGCTSQKPSNNSTEPKIYLVPISNSPSNSSTGANSDLVLVDIPEFESAGFGDIISVNYSLYVNGTLYDTNVRDVATQANLSRLPSAFSPLTFPMILNKSIINGFVLNLIGMQKGDTKTFNVSPGSGYGFVDPSQILSISRYQNLSLYENVSLIDLQRAGINTSVGSGFETASGFVFINSTTSTTATLYYLFTPGSRFTFQGIPQHVVSVDSQNALLEYDFALGMTYRVPHPETGEVEVFTVVSKDNESLTLDYNHPLAGKNLTFNVTVLSVQRQVPRNSISQNSSTSAPSSVNTSSISNSSTN